MQNVEFKTVEGKLHIIVDPTQDHGPTKSGKSISVAKTEGWGQKIRVGGQVMTVAVNVYKPMPDFVPEGTVDLG